MKKFLSGFLSCALIVGVSLSALAISGRMTIDVDPINIQVNGKTFAPTDVDGKEVPVFAYEGTTYAPLRALAEAYGLEVGYDQAANMATVKDPDAKPSATPAPDTTAKTDYSDWSAEDEAAYQEFKGLWEDIGTTENPKLIADIDAVKAYAAKTPKDKAYSYIKRMSEECLALSNGFVGLTFWDKDKCDGLNDALLGVTNNGESALLIFDDVWDNVPYELGTAMLYLNL